jgi:hypothetical protein
MDSEKKLSLILDFRCQIVVLDFRWLSWISDRIESISCVEVKCLSILVSFVYDQV